MLNLALRMALNVTQGISGESISVRNKNTILDGCCAVHRMGLGMGIFGWGVDIEHLTVLIEYH